MKARVVEIALTMTVDTDKTAEQVREGISRMVDHMADRTDYIICHDSSITSDRETDIDVD